MISERVEQCIKCADGMFMIIPIYQKYALQSLRVKAGRVYIIMPL